MKKENNNPELRPEYINKLKKIRKGNFIMFHNIDELKKSIENNDNHGCD